MVSAIANGRRLYDQMTILVLRRTPFGWDYEDSVTPEMRTSFNLNSMYLTGASPLPPETTLSSSSVSSRVFSVTFFSLIVFSIEAIVALRPHWLRISRRTVNRFTGDT